MSLTVTINQFSGGVTEIPPSTALVATSNYLWELMGPWGIRAMKYTGGSGVVVGPGGGGIIGSGKIPYKLKVTIPGSSSVSQGSTYQNNQLINAVDLYDFLLNGASYQINFNNTFTFNSTTGTIDISSSGNTFFGQDELIIPFAQYVNQSGASTLRVIQYVPDWPTALLLTNKNGFVQVAVDVNNSNNTSLYEFLDNGTLNFVITVATI